MSTPNAAPNAAPDPKLVAMRKVEHVHQRFAFACGYLPPRSAVAYGGCTGCGQAMPLVNVRSWPDDPALRTGECVGCGSTLAVQDGPKREVQRA